MKKKLTAILLAAAMAVTGLFTAMTPEKANAAEWEACDIPVIKDVSEFDAVSAMYSKTITVTKKDKNIEQGYGSFQLKSDSWVILKTTSSLVTSQEDGHQTHIEVFSDASASNKVLETGDGYWEYDGDQYTILKKGTYYFHTKSSCQNYDTFTGNINVVVKGSLPDYDLVGVYSRTASKAAHIVNKMQQHGKPCIACAKLEELLALKPDYLVESASPAAMRELALPALKNGKIGRAHV